jgi:hypothetical protein
MSLMQVHPKEEFGPRNMKINDTDRNGCGEISVRISPYINAVSICGELELSAIDGSSTKKHWCCLLDASLSIYNKYTDSEPRMVIAVSKAMSVQFVEKEEKMGRVKKKSVRYIEIKMRADEIYLLKCVKTSDPNLPTESEWMAKLKKNPRFPKHGRNNAMV